MRIIALLSALMVAVLVGACGTIGGYGPIGYTQIADRLRSVVPCVDGNCYVPVTVKACLSDGSGISTPTDAVSLGGPGNGSTRGIVWIIITRGYRFTTQGLDVKDAGTFFGAPSYLPQRTVIASDVSVTTQNKQHGYGLRVEKTDGTSCGELDPWVIE